MFYDVTFEPMKIPTLSASQSWYHIKNSQLYESDLLIGCSFKTEMIFTNQYDKESFEVDLSLVENNNSTTVFVTHELLLQF